MPLGLGLIIYDIHSGSAYIQQIFGSCILILHSDTLGARQAYKHSNMNTVSRCDIVRVKCHFGLGLPFRANHI